MKLITRDSDYAMQALCSLAQDRGKVLSLDTVFLNTKIPRFFLRKILQILSNKKIVNSYKGKKGGFLLLRDPEKIRFIDIIEIFQGKFSLIEHRLGQSRCPRVRSCSLKDRIDQIERGLLKDLSSITVASLLDK